MPFGEMLMEQTSGDYDNVYKYNGKELDESTGLYYYGARYYDPRTSIWLSVDPLAEKYPNFSPYVYTFNNPIVFVDPTGMEGKGVKTDFLNKAGELVKHVEDGSNAVFQQTGDKHSLHYEFSYFDEEQGGENTVNLSTAIQEQQNLNLSNPSLEPDGATYCNFATQNILKTVVSATDNSSSLNIAGLANDMTPQFANTLTLQSATLNEARAAAKNGSLALYGWENPGGHGHVGSFSVGDNIAKGETANVGARNGFKSISNVFSKKQLSQVKYYTLNPNVTPKSGGPIRNVTEIQEVHIIKPMPAIPSPRGIILH
ncbi:MAG: RHS repeat-associated core domain-containing protein [Flavobacteriaceae bacterium]|jgi:RHS repeat-associated protein|nr:RHS repeat-associated core domain-containing protein [Flavobacteriaceae bacterium]